MKIMIRTDSSREIGTGHVMRCLTLSTLLQKNGAEVLFVCRDLPGNIITVIEKNKYRVIKLPYDSNMVQSSYSDEYARWLVVSQKNDFEDILKVKEFEKNDFDWLIVDHYGLDHNWEKQMRKTTNNIMVIDDLANREHDCDLILDQNLYDNLDSRYDKLVPQNCIKKLGPKYALLRDEFIEERKKLRNRDGVVRRVLVFYGGSDNSSETLKALEAIIQLKLNSIKFDIIVGSSNKNKDKIKEICSRYENLTFHSQISNMAELMAQADLALGAGGTTTYERYCLGLPTIVTSVATNQIEIAKAVGRSNISIYLGGKHEVLKEDMMKGIMRVIDNPEQLKVMTERALSFNVGHKIDFLISTFCEEKNDEKIS